MPAADHTYVIGAIRHHERGLLQADEYTRLREAADVPATIQALVETPYGQWLKAGEGSRRVSQAITERLNYVKNWLTDVTADSQLLTVITARYDALNAATAVIAFRTDQETAQLSPLGSINPDSIISALWHNVGWETLPPSWRAPLQRERAMANSSPTWKIELIKRLEHDLVTILAQHATTPLTRGYAAMTADRIATESILRRQEQFKHRVVSKPITGLTPTADTATIAAALHEAGYDELTTEHLEAIRNQADASQYELAWDLHRLKQLRRFQADPTGADPIAAFWFKLEIEAKTIRLLLAAKAQGITGEQLAQLERPVVRHI